MTDQSLRLARPKGTALRVAIVVAQNRKRVIGREGRIPWDLPADRAFFRGLTLGHAVIMGRRTFENLSDPLPGRTNLVVSNAPRCPFPAGVRQAHALDEALHIADRMGHHAAFVIGGAALYAEALDHRQCHTAWITEVENDEDGDTFFPLMPGRWFLYSYKAIDLERPLFVGEWSAS